ncbi:HRDC domain-containing protein [Bacillus sp. OTU530]|uniref:HRDC domain-containing protein n=1 Tax=Bacillus sp. OTU530 TaxID=3043862 RepID=UPI00313AAE77
MRKEAMVVTRVVADDALFTALRQVRKEIAAEEQVPPFVIVSDETLRDLCTKLPQTKEALLGVKGIGATKQERYGARFLQVIADYLGSNPSYAPAVEVQEQPKEKEKAAKQPSHLATYERCTSRGKVCRRLRMSVSYPGLRLKIILYNV